MNPLTPVDAGALLYLSGPPGAGKSTAMRRLLAGAHTQANVTRPFYHVRLGATGRCAHLGKLEGRTFPGTDSLSMNVVGTVERWLGDLWSPPYLLAEGDRLANLRFFNAALGSGRTITFVHLDAPDDVLHARRLQRAADLNVAPQHDSWARGRATKARNLLTTMKALSAAARPVTVIDTSALTDPIGHLERALEHHPALVEARTSGDAA